MSTEKFVPPDDIVVSDLEFQRKWSDDTFGKGARTTGVLKHIEKEIQEVRESPDDVFEWVDLIILAIDGATRRGISPKALIRAYHAKMIENVLRDWPEPPPGGFPEDVAVEHVREVGA